MPETPKALHEIDPPIALRVALRELCARFVDEVVALVVSPPKPRSSAPRPRSRRKAVDVSTLTQAVRQVIDAEGPIATAAIARAVGATSDAVAHPLRILLASGAIEKQGDRRGSRYIARPHVVPRAKSKAKSPKKNRRKA